MLSASDLTGVSWTKSSFSASVANCVEAAEFDGGVAVRNSRSPEDGALLFTRSEFAAFVAGARDGDFDHLI